jgi:hypothetical protein
MLHFSLSFAQNMILIFCSNNLQDVSGKQTNHSMNEILTAITKYNESQEM